MAGENTKSDTQKSHDPADEGDEKLIFGKYKTLEDAEKGYKEAERKLHETNEKNSRFEERFDRLESRLDEGYSRGQQVHQVQEVDDSTQVLTEFYKNPKKVLSEVKAQAVREAKEELRREAQSTNAHAVVVQKWTDRNKDVAAYPELLTYWVQQTDPKLSVETRLENAAEKVRARILELRGKPEQGEPDPDDVTEGVDQGGRKPAASGKPRATVLTDPESELAKYTTSRNSRIRKPLGMHATEK
jgi:uncharacterized protein YbjQ (UPF0145 family)